MVRLMGLEPIRRNPHAPQTCASASSATAADQRLLNCRGEVSPKAKDYYTQIFRFVKGFLKFLCKNFFADRSQPLGGIGNVGKQGQAGLDLQKILLVVAAMSVGTNGSLLAADAGACVADDGGILAICANFLQLLGLDSHGKPLLSPVLLLLLYHIFRRLSRGFSKVF